MPKQVETLEIFAIINYFICDFSHEPTFSCTEFHNSTSEEISINVCVSFERFALKKHEES